MPLGPEEKNMVGFAIRAGFVGRSQCQRRGSGARRRIKKRISVMPIHTVLVTVAVLFGAAPGFAQTQAPPAQIDNHANGFDYQPTDAQMKAREEAAGVRPDQQQKQQEDQTLQRLDRQLLSNQGLQSGTQAPK
jgi:hypothetical protein